jgi:hypothetical protein
MKPAKKVAIIYCLALAGLALLTGCTGSECVQVWADYTFIYPNEQGLAVAVFPSGEYYAPIPLEDGCYRLRRPELGTVGTMEYVAPFCKGAK